jgi:hypothetical protein
MALRMGSFSASARVVCADAERPKKNRQEAARIIDPGRKQ